MIYMGGSCIITSQESKDQSLCWAACKASIKYCFIYVIFRLSSRTGYETLCIETFPTFKTSQILQGKTQILHRNVHTVSLMQHFKDFSLSVSFVPPGGMGLQSVYFFFSFQYSIICILISSCFQFLSFRSFQHLSLNCWDSRMLVLHLNQLNLLLLSKYVFVLLGSSNSCLPVLHFKTCYCFQDVSI